MSGTRWDEDNRVALNPWAFVVVGGLIGLLVGLGVLFWLF